MSYLCQLYFLTSTGQRQPHIAEIQHFVRASRGDGQVKRLASCRLMKATVGEEGLLKVTPGQARSTESALVDIDMIDCKPVTAWDGPTLYGAPYANTSGMA